MFAQMLRDDQRLKNLHRETIKRRKRFLAKQKKLQQEEENRRINALEKRKRQRNKYLPILRKNKNQNGYGNNIPIRVKRTKISKIDKNYDEFSTFIVPVCDQLSPNKNIRKKNKRKKIIKPANDIHKNQKNKTNPMSIESEEKNDNEQFEHFDNAMSDQLSVAELDNFDKKHFGIQQSIQCRKSNNKTNLTSQINDKQNSYSNNSMINCVINEKSNGYQQIFKKNIKYKTDLKQSNIIKSSINESINESLFNINNIDMKTPEDYDSVKINPNDSIDCSKISFCTVYNSHLLPLKSVLENKMNKRNMKATPLIKKPTQYGIKLPRLTESILKQKDRIDSHQSTNQNTYQRSPNKSTFSAPVWNKYNNIAMNRRRNTTTIIDDFFTKTCDEFVDSHRNSNNTLFLPNINRKKLKPKSRLKQKRAYSVMSEYDILKQEKKLERSLLKINETLSNLTIPERNYDSSKQIIKKRNRNINNRNGRKYGKYGKIYRNYLNETRVSSIPRKIKVKRSPTFKSRTRQRWNI